MSLASAVRGALDLLTKRDQRLLLLAVSIQMATAILDLTGVLLIGLLGATAVTTVQSQPLPSYVQTALDILGVSGLSDQEVVLLLAGAAASVFIVKSVVSVYLTRRVFAFLANRQALVSARLTAALFAEPLSVIQRRSSQETSYALITGASAATILLLGQCVVALTELALLVVLACGLLLISPWLAVGAVAFFALLALALHFSMARWASRVGLVMAETDVASRDAVQEGLAAYRELSVLNRRQYFVDRIQELRWIAARGVADSQFMGLFPKYLFEAALVVGGLVLAGVLFVTQDAVVAVGTLALFVAAGTRIMPAILRLQGSAIIMRSAAEMANPTFDLSRELAASRGQVSETAMLEQRARDEATYTRAFSPSVVVDSVSFTYPGQGTPAISDVSFALDPGTSLAVVGRSGAGKSTLVDVILGVLAPSHGSVLVSGESPAKASTLWPGQMAYVPQAVMVSATSVRDNVALGLPREDIDDERVWSALQEAHLGHDLISQGLSLDAHLGEAGFKLSGGQRQRLAIARALYSSPRLLVLDEATSALDAETESALTDMLVKLAGRTTLIVIAHRLSTVRTLDRMIYLDRGSVAAEGTFEEVQVQVPAFARQLKLMGSPG